MSEAVKKVWHSKEIVKPDDDVIARFWRQVSKEGPVPDQLNPFYKGLGRCWDWVGYRSKVGYGAIGINRSPKMAHRVSYAIAHGVAPAGSMVMHLCDNTFCVNPDHLVLGDAIENMKDRDRKGRAASGDRNGSRAKPENLRRGDNHPKHLKPWTTPRGDEHGRAVLTEANVRDMRRRFDAGECKIIDLAKEFGVQKSTARKVVRRKNWKHVP